MRALLRTLLAVVGILGLVVVGAVVYITTFFDPEDLKPHLVEVVRDQSGLELTLDGPLAWSFYPRLGLSVADAQARLPDQPANEQAFLAFDQAEVSLAFSTLLSGQVAIDGLSLDGMRLNLKRDGEGRGNWQTLLDRLERQQELAAIEAEAKPAVAEAEASGETTDNAASTASNESGSESPSSQLPGELGGKNGVAVALDIARVDITDGSIRYSDRQSGQAWHLDSLNISGSNVNPAKPFPLKADFALSSFLIPEGQSREADAQWVSQMKLDSQVELGLDDGRYVLSDLKLDTTTQLAGADGKQQKVNLRFPSLEANMEAGRYVLEGGKLEASLSHPSLGEKSLPLTLTFAADANLEAQTLRISEWQLSGEDSLTLGGNLHVEELLEAPQYRGQVALEPLSLRTWLERLGSLPETADDAALDSLALTSPLEGDLERVSLPSLNLTLDDTTLSGSLSAGLDGRSLALDLQGDVLNLDRYLPPVEEGNDDAQASAESEDAVGAASQAGAAAVSEAGDELVPAATLKSLNLDADIALERLTVKNMDLEQVVLKARGSNGQLRLEQFDARFFDGTLAASAGLDLREAPLRWRFTPTVKDVSAEPFLAALTGEASPLRGKLNLNGELTTRGNSADELPARLNGQLSTRINEGAVLDVNVSEELCTAVALLEGKQTSRDWRPDTRFDSASATLNIRNGEVRNDDLDISIPGIQVTGEGKVGLVDKRFDYRAAARFVDTADAACEVNPRLTKVPLPVRCEGSLSGAPADWCRFDRGAFRDAVTNLARQEIEEKASEEVQKRLDEALEGVDERIGEGASGELRNALKGLFN